MYCDYNVWYNIMRNIKLVGRQDLIYSSTGKIHDDVGLYALNGIKEIVIEVNDEDDIQDEINRYVDNHPDWENYNIEIYFC